MIRTFKKYIESSKIESIHRTLPNYHLKSIDFSSNDYLGLSRDARVLESGILAAKQYGSGATGSRLLSGNSELFENFEKQIAIDKKTESALIFNSGYQANSGVIECLSDKDTLVIFDKLNHASMYQGVFASKAQLIRYHHLDYGHLNDILKENSNRKIIIVSETVFGMDGDIADINVLSQLSEKFGALLYLDEAHATGLYGTHGYGLSTMFNLNKEHTIIMGTLSKAIGSSGAYIACSNLIKDFLIQKCKSFIYSTAISPFCIGAAQKAWELVKSLSETRKNILNNAEYLRSKLNALGDMTNIVPIIFKDTTEMLRKKEDLQNAGIIVSGIRHPTSPTPRIRIALNAKHSKQDIEKLIQEFNI